MQLMAPMQDAALHNTRLAQYRHPLGALRQGAQLTLRVNLRACFKEAVVIASIHTEGRDKLLEMRDIMPQPGFARTVEVCLGLPDSPGLLWYYFIINDRTTLYYLGRPDGNSGWAHLKHSEVNAFQVTVYRPSQPVEWAMGANCYQIFVDRFARPEGTLGGLARLQAYKERNWRVIEHKNWEDEPNYLPLKGEHYYDPCDFFGGDLYGVAEKLPYLSKLGIQLLYLNPIFEAPSNHKYDTADYHHVDPLFGGDAGLAHLLDQAKQYGIRIILDGVFSHTGMDSVYFDAKKRYGSGAVSAGTASPYYDWYTFERFPDKYRSWWGFSSLPEVNEMQPGYVEFVARSENSVVNDYARRGISGWRLDVADELPDAFIEELCAALKRADPDNLLIGEVWEDASNKFSLGEQRKYVMGKELDGVMNYPYRQALLDFLMSRMDARAFADAVLALYDHYPKAFLFSCMTLLSTHDVPRARTVLSGAPHTQGVTQAQQRAYKPSAAAFKRARQRQRLAVLMQAVLPGMPTVYYADEAGAQGMSDPFNRGTYPWGKEDDEMLRWYQKVLKLHTDHQVLKTGHFTALAPHPDVAVLLRFSGRSDALGRESDSGFFCACINRAESVRTVEIQLQDSLECVEEIPSLHEQDILADLITGAEYRLNDGVLSMELPPFGCVWLKRH